MAEHARSAEGAGERRVAKGPILLQDRYRFDPDKALNDLDSPSAKAFHVEDRRDTGRALFGLICTPGLPPRTEVMSVLRGATMRGILPLVDWGVVFWPPLGQFCMAVVYERPLGGRVADTPNSANFRVSEYDLPRRMVEPLLGGLLELQTRQIAHRAIRPNNLFFMDTERQIPVLGECVTAPPGFDQPSVFEPIERAMASHGGRGAGGTKDDIYALGVTMVFLLLGQNPVAKLSEEELIATKVEFGTYATLCGRERVPVSMLEPLRGMLSDDVAERWSPDELDLWINGRQMTPMQKKAAPRADVPFAFAGRDHHTLRTLAHAFSQHVAEAAKLIRAIKPAEPPEAAPAKPGTAVPAKPPPAPGPEMKRAKEGRLYAWIRRNMKNQDLAEQVATIAELGRIHENNWQGSDDYLVTRTVLALDPAGPIRHKGFAFVPDAFGPALAVELLRRGNAQVPAECLTREIPTLWATAQPYLDAEATALIKTFAQLRGFLQINDPGYGIERCLYELNPSLPCQSPLVIKDYVVEAKDLLPALDDAAARVEPKTKPMDRHIAAFIAARFHQDIDPHLRALASPVEETSLIGMLSLLAFLQWRLRAEPYYGLASWVGGMLGPAINTYHSRATRQEIERGIPRLVRQGGLPELFDLIDNAEKRRADAEAFAKAVAEFTAAEVEARGIEGGGAARAESAQRLGQQAAAMTSIVLAMIVIAVLFLLQTV